MKSKPMAYLFIILGLALVAVGVYIVLQKPAAPATLLKADAPTQDTKTQTTNTADESKEKGNQFERFVINQIGSLPGVKLIHKNADYHQDGITAIGNMEPDLKFTIHGRPFAVECKWRKDFKDNTLYWAEERQVENYRRYADSSGQPVYVAIGVGGEPLSPAAWYLVPLRKLTRGFAMRHYIAEDAVTDSTKLLSTIVQQAKP